VHVQDRSEQLCRALAVVAVVAPAGDDPRLVVVVPVEAVPANLGQPCLPAPEDSLEVAQAQRADLVSFGVRSSVEDDYRFDLAQYVTGLFSFWGCAVLIRPKRGISSRNTSALSHAAVASRRSRICHYRKRSENGGGRSFRTRSFCLASFSPFAYRSLAHGITTQPV
jgi:hypothetical protein